MSVLLNEVAPDPQIERISKALSPLAFDQKNDFERIAVIGLGYVGLPLATHLAARFENVLGFDINVERIAALEEGFDQTGEVGAAVLTGCGLKLSMSPSELQSASFYIVTVPTPITSAHQPDLSPLKSACRTIAPHLKSGDVVVFESTVYPGVTEDICGPLLQDLSGLRLGADFTVGYSPERINPGDRINTVQNITKVVSAQDAVTLDRITRVYEQIITAGLYRCSNIKVAECAKVLENTQRDVNIALMNEVSLICDRLNIESREVIETASTKWNFLKFEPGLVGGHCIGVDPYYLASLADQLGLHSEVILAGRKINDGMVDHVADRVLRMLIKTGKSADTARIGVFGITFKEDIPDIRNSKAIDLVNRLRDYGLNPLVHDPHCSAADAQNQCLTLADQDSMSNLDIMIIACPHRVYRRQTGFLNLAHSKGAIIDVKGAFAKHAGAKSRLYWSL